MNYAVIDLGSNSIRLSIYDCSGDQINKIFSKKEIVGLASYISNKSIDIIGILKACEVLNDFKESATKYVEESDIHLFATAALRSISNRDEAVQTIIEKTTLAPDILEGDEEAALGFIGASHFKKYENGIMIDIGGASTELVLFKDYRPVELVSLPIGCLNLSNRFVREIIPSTSERKLIKAEIQSQLDKISWDDSGKCPLMVGIGGTLRAAGKISGVLFDLNADEVEINADYVRIINKLLKERQRGIYHTLYKTIPERLLTISTGIAILHQVAKKFGCESISVSKYIW